MESEAESSNLQWFCGANTTGFQDYDNKLYDSCFVDFVHACVQTLFLVGAALILIISGCCCTNLRRYSSKTLIPYPGHNARYIITIVTWFILLCSVAEGILTDVTRNDITQPHLYIAPSLALINGIVFIVYYHYAEYWNRPSFAWFLLVYWVLAIASQAIILINLSNDGVGIDILRFDLTIVLCIIYCLFLLIELNLLRTKVFGWCYTKDEYPRDLRRQDMTYIHDYTSLLSRITFQWLNWLLVLGYKRPVEMDDLGGMAEQHDVKHQYSRFLEAYEKEKKRAETKNVTPSLWRTQGTAYRWTLLTSGILYFLSACCGFVGPVAIGVVVSYATKVYYGSDDDEIDTSYVTVSEFFSNGFVMVVIMFTALIYRSFTFQYGNYIIVMESIHFRASLQTHVYEKTLRLSTWTMTSGERSMGQITNYMSVDAYSVFWLYVFMHFLWQIPFQLIVILVLLYVQLGYSALIGASLFLITTPIQLRIGGAMSAVQKSILKYADERLKKSNEMLQGIKLLKLYGWEDMFCKATEAVRNREIKALLKYGYCMMATLFLTQATPAIVTLISFAVYSFVSETPLRPDIAFSSLALFQQLILPLMLLPMTIGATVNAIVSLSRLQTFFVASEIEENKDGRAPLSTAQCQMKEDGDEDDLIDTNQENATNVKTKTVHGNVYTTLSQEDDHKDGTKLLSGNVVPYGTFNEETSLTESHPLTKEVPGDVAIMIRDATYSWELGTPVPILKDVDLDIPRGKLTLVVGLVGSGKSSLLSAMLGEMTTLSGNVQFNRNGSKIAYGAQRAWLQNATLRDNVLFGEPYDPNRYQEVISACALQPDIDILPGGDKTEIGEKGINLSGGQKQRVSIARAMYGKADIVLLDDPLSALDVHVGRHLMTEGILGLLLKENRTVVLVTHQLQFVQNAEKIVVLEDGKVALQGNLNQIANEDPELYASWKRTLTVLSESEESESEAEKVEVERQKLLRQVSKKKEEDEIKEKAGTTLMAEEERERGSVSWRVYLAYGKAVKLPLVCLTLGLLATQVTMLTLNSFWLSAWSETGANYTNASMDQVEADLGYWVGGYAGFSLGYVVCALAASLCFVVTNILAAKRIHIALLRNIIHAPMRFFDTTPMGRALNRLSSDTQIIDMRLWQTLQALCNTTLSSFAAIVVNAVVTPLFLAFILPVFIVYFIVQNYFITTSRELQRLDSITKSPVFAHFSETLGGLSTVRAYRDERRFRKRIVRRIDFNNLAFIFLQTTNRWLAIRLDLVGSLIVLTSGLATLVTSAFGSLEPSLVGLALSYALQISGFLNFMIRQIADCEMQMNAVERVLHYTHIDTEKYEGSDQPSIEWPSAGNVSYEDVSVRYAIDLEPVLTKVTLNFRAGEKIGICGRTGSGKSSLALSLFRLIDNFEGRIFIDGIDISQVPLLTLRNRLAIIPQDPVLFTGTIRFNLDPECNRDDEELWEALEIAQLKTTVTELEKQLESDISEGGENFSVGQRQLFCLARAFLRKAKILVMDEATASIDMQTDAILQNVVATAFGDRTVLTIAHRVSTILDSDTILVLSDGKVVEYDTPENLRKREGSIFASLVKGNS
ncbi:ATP-binding cassette sub-family C member 9-like [Glandiceps talaboti]